MEIRCGSCNKLFRVSDDKITGTGIKFPCTRCGDYIKITKQDFEQYTFSQTAASVLDTFDPKPKSLAVPMSQEVRETVPPAQEAKTFDFSELSSDQEMPEESPSPFAESDHFSTSMPAAESDMLFETQPQGTAASETKAAPSTEAQPEVVLESNALASWETMPASSLGVEPEPKPELKPEPKPEPQIEPKPLMSSQPKPTPPAAPVVHPGMPEKERAVVQPEHEREEKAPMPSSKRSHSGRMILVLLAALIIGALAIYGVFVYFQVSPQQKREKQTLHEMTSVNGIQIVNPSGSMEQNGDLLVTGIIENTTEKEVAAWYVVVEVYDPQTALLGKLRYLNGKQIYSLRDFDILAKRGMNVHELKTKYLQEKGVVLPPKGSVNFEMHYLQPPAGIASFNALVLPFDPVQLYKEIAEEMK